MVNRLGYLRVSLLNSCNLNCFYCRPLTNIEEKKYLTQINKFASSIKLLYSTGVRKVRFTGGEPTLYKNLPELISYTKKLDNSIHTSLTSNAVLLQKKARILAESGLDSINISVDTLDRKKFYHLTGENKLTDVLKGIIACLKFIPKVKLNTVMIKGFNDNEVNRLIKFADNLKVDIRFIEYMPTKYTASEYKEFIAGDDIKNNLPFALEPAKSDPSTAARYYRSPDLNIKVGFINPVSHSFCSQCNRIRLTSDGQLYSCLFSTDSFNLFDALKYGYDNASQLIHKLIHEKSFSGCSPFQSSLNNLPSFVNMGG
ncbi:MAG: GTP 3',8-cyclase MoaA [Candidatus Zixiibacteriota bacterium]